jgi:predicted ATP-grasp superfamily ATP-dependent carboligase
MGFDLRRFHPERPPVMLLGGLNLVRALGLGGIPAIVASPQADAPALSSRFVQGRLLLPPLEQRAAVLQTLLAAGERLTDALGRKVPLFYGDDDYLDLIRENYAALERFFAFILNEPEVAHALIDKDRFEAFARSRGLPVPRTLAWEELDGWYAPVLAKPKVKMGYGDSPIYQRLFGGAGKARIFASGPEITAIPLVRQLREELLFQEYVPGNDRHLWSFHGYADEKGALLASFIGRKIRTWPPRTGSSSYLELVHDDAFAFVGRHIAARVPLRGVFKIDFKQDAVSGAWRVLEINARSNLWHYLAARNGLNLPRIAYEYLVYGKRPAEAPPYRTAWRWLSLRADYRAYRGLAARGELGAWGWLCSLAESPKVYQVFSWSDPVPFFKHCIKQVRLRVPRLTARLARWLSTAS